MPVSANWIVCPVPRPQAHLRLFCVPYAGGGSSIFRNWPRELPPEIEVCLIQLPGRESRWKEPAFTYLPSLVEALSDAISPHLHKPFALFGYSMGALVAFELARTLRQHGVEPVHLFAAAHRAPQIPSPHDPIHHLPEQAFLNELKELNGTPERVLQNLELIQLLLPVLRADFEVCETYQYTPENPLACPISAFGGVQDEKISQENLDAWRAQTSNTFALRMFPADHFFLYNFRSSLLQAICQDLAHSWPRRELGFMSSSHRSL